MSSDRSRSPYRSRRFRSSERASYRNAPYPRDSRTYRYVFLSLSILLTQCLFLLASTVGFCIAHDHIIIAITLWFCLRKFTYNAWPLQARFN